MLTAAENELLTRVGPATPMGALLRRYWQPIGTRDEMAARWTKRVRILGENLVLYKTRQGAFGLIAESCPHRAASLAYGIPTADGIRCPYHGWQFDGSGRCTEQPNEPAESAFKDKVRTAGYPVAELGGLLWGYLGPLPAPLIPRLDGFVAEGTIRTLGLAVIPCNWLQIMENSLDTVHTEWLHGKLYEFRHEDEGVHVAMSRHHFKVGFDECAYGIVKRRVLEGNTENDDDWAIGHPVFFPNTLASGNAAADWREYRFNIRVPMDDTTTLHYFYSAWMAPPGVEAPRALLDTVHTYHVPYLDEHGEYLLDAIHAQDIMAWITQGPIADRTKESLNSTDRGITLYRRMLLRELKRMEAGLDPMNVIRDPAGNGVIELPVERKKGIRADTLEGYFRRHFTGYVPVADQIIALFKSKEPASAGR